MAALIGWLLLDEQMPPLARVGLALAAAGVAIATRANNVLVRHSRSGVRP
jgi:drug/metabolite transporter (DMT)-like permease